MQQPTAVAAACPHAHANTACRRRTRVARERAPARHVALQEAEQLHAARLLLARPVEHRLLYCQDGGGHDGVAQLEQVLGYDDLGPFGMAVCVCARA